MRNPSTFQKQNKFWTFWETLLFHSLSTAKLLPLVFFSKKFKVFPKTYLFFKKSSNSLNLLRKLPISVQIKFKLPFSKTSRFIFEKPIFSCKKPSFWTFWEISLFRSHSKSNWLTVSVAVDIKLANLSCLQKIKFHFRKKTSIF